MRATSWQQVAVLASGLALVAGCAGAPPSSTTAATTTAQTPTRHVQSVDSKFDEKTFKEIRSKIPASMDKATADRLLVSIDADKVDHKRTAQWFGRFGGYGRGLGLGYGGYGGYGLGYGGYGGCGIGAFGCGYPYSSYLVGSYRYLPMGGYYFPYTYSSISSLYTPYLYGSYAPFMTYSAPFYRPYFYRGWY